MEFKIQNSETLKRRAEDFFRMSRFECRASNLRPRGFTLIEMMVSVFLFSIVIVIATGALVSILGANRKAQAVKSVMNNLNFALDSMTRSIRTGTDYDCGTAQCDPTNGTSEFSFTDTDGRDVIYRLNNATERIEREVDKEGFLPLTSPGVIVERLTFYVDGESDTDREQPRVLIILKGEAGEGKTLTTFNLETLVSQRILDR
jgi:prepilin-type N-terminal cleavage/methylation domain-containing protein